MLLSGFICIRKQNKYHQGRGHFFFPPNGLAFLNVICKILREELLLLRACSTVSEANLIITKRVF